MAINIKLRFNLAGGPLLVCSWLLVSMRALALVFAVALLLLILYGDVNSQTKGPATRVLLLFLAHVPCAANMGSVLRTRTMLLIEHTYSSQLELEPAGSSDCKL
jgi:hypothetical protein